MARTRLIPTEATPRSSPAGTPEPSAYAHAAKVKAPSAAQSLNQTASTSTSVAPVQASPTQVANGFVALPVRLQPACAGFPECITQHIYFRPKAAEHDNTSVAASSSGSSTVFAVNLPYGSTESQIKRSIEALLTARARASAKGKGRASDVTDFTVQAVELVKQQRPQHPIRGQSILENEGIHHPDQLLLQAEKEELSKQSQNLPKKQKKALQQQQMELKSRLEAYDQDASSSIHPLFVTQDISLEDALNHLFPSSSTLKAHITLSSPKAVDILLKCKEGTSWNLSLWPDKSSLPTTAQDQRTRDEILFDLSRPHADSVKLHVDSWMKVFDEQHPSHTRTSNQSIEDDVPKSKRAQARETAAKAHKLAQLDKKKALKRRRLYDDDYDEPEADADGWVTVTAGGSKGRSGPGEEDELEDEEEMRQAELEGFASGKRSVAVARKEFVRETEREMQEERRKEVAALNAKLGIMTEEDQLVGLPGGLNNEDEDESRGGGRGRKKEMKKSKGVEMGMYGFAKRDENKKNLSDLRKRFEEDKKKIEEMKQQKLFRPY